MTHWERKSRRQRIELELREKIAVSEIAARHDVTEAFVLNIARAAKIEISGYHEMRTKYSTFSVIADLINTPKSYTELSVIHKCTRQNIGLIAIRAKEAGIKLHPEREEHVNVKV